MKNIGAVLCLIALASVGGGISNSTTSPATRPFTSLDQTYRDGSTQRKQGEYQRAADLFGAGLVEAKRHGEPALEARFLWGLANCHFALRRYQEALSEYLEARDAYARLGEGRFVRALNGNIGSLYSQLGEIEAAIAAMKGAVEDDPALEFSASRIKRLVTLATLLAENNRREESARMFREAILAADRIDDPELLSNAWDRLGGELLSRGELAPAEDALLEAFRIRKVRHLPSLAGSYGKLGMLRLAQGDTRSASALLDAAVEESKSSRVRIPEWRFYHSRGRLRLVEGRIGDAHADFRLALELARNYRLTTPASDATRVSLEGVLQPVYASFVETGSRLYFETGRPEIARETLEALEENRASSLGARAAERPRLRRKMPAAYWDALAELQSAESAALLDDSDTPRQAMRRLRGEIIGMEARAGDAGFRRTAGVPSLQRRLDGDTAVLSFHLGEESSRLWALSASDLSLYQLPGRSIVLDAARRFRAALLSRDPSSEQLGRELYLKLFGGLGAHYRSKTRWLLSLDEGLFDIPFAALVDCGADTRVCGVETSLDALAAAAHRRKASRRVSTRQTRVSAPRWSSSYLVERHSLRIVSGAATLLDAPPPRAIAGRFAGVGDAVYNTADPRWRRGGSMAATLGLTRLPGSAAEIAACARQWRGGSVLLQGSDVSRANVRRIVEGGASVVHFATHMVGDSEAMISLSLNPAGRDELIGASEIGGWNVAVSLVALSGCGSGAAAALPGAGLMGITRAWLMAGAGAVIATGWSIPDDAEGLFPAFYREFQDGDSRDPAAALRAAQIAALRSGGWRSHPAYWAAYFTLGNY